MIAGGWWEGALRRTRRAVEGDVFVFMPSPGSRGRVSCGSHMTGCLSISPLWSLARSHFLIRMSHQLPHRLLGKIKCKKSVDSRVRQSADREGGPCTCRLPGPLLAGSRRAGGDETAGRAPVCRWAGAAELDLRPVSVMNPETCWGDRRRSLAKGVRMGVWGQSRSYNLGSVSAAA